MKKIVFFKKPSQVFSKICFAISICFLALGLLKIVPATLAGVLAIIWFCAGLLSGMSRPAKPNPLLKDEDFSAN